MHDENGSSGVRSDALQRLFVRPSFLSLTVGIPFGTYKLLFGLSALRAVSPIFGLLVVTWALADLGMNVARLGFDLSGRPAPFEYCTIAQLGRLLGRPTVFLAIDTLLTFVVLCLMLWTGWIGRLAPIETWLWNGATTLNLISLSFVALYNEMRRP